MRLIRASVLAVVAASLMPVAHSVAFQMDPDRVVPGGGIFAAGWKGRIDPQSVKQGRTVNDSKFEMKGDVITLAIGPAAVYWNPANKAAGDYVVKGTFKEPKYMSANSHAHPYGVFIGGSDMDADAPTLVYCIPYGDGRVLVRGFSKGVVFNMARAAANAAVNKAAADGSVTQNVQWTVKGGRAECSINGQVVAGYTKEELVGAGKLDALDGIYGIRVSHNLDVVVTGFGMSK